MMHIMGKNETINNASEIKLNLSIALVKMLIHLQGAKPLALNGSRYTREKPNLTLRTIVKLEMS